MDDDDHVDSVDDDESAFLDDTSDVAVVVVADVDGPSLVSVQNLIASTP